MKPTALISVFDKHGILEFARELETLGWDLISSGGTARHLLAGGVKTRDVAELSGRGAILGHRVVTLMPEVHGGLLAVPAMLDELNALGFPWIDLVCVDLYPLKEAVSKPDATLASVLEKTDIGG
ncbi:MAG: bifunctional phosphoribosylaminoimidazolecarboxamide formyltransferase/IMP cyclohydrolase, partial [Patescibacteria group bacterium]|nr:bifunctional phosphoribosylaminoimidazolecarboxamide formyltransferase/IMP cyclohydrolase [Patescibacteria group bacterium]